MTTDPTNTVAAVSRPTRKTSLRRRRPIATVVSFPSKAAACLVAAVAIAGLSAAPSLAATSTALTADPEYSASFCEPVRDLRELKGVMDTALTNGRDWDFLRARMIDLMRESRRANAVLLPQSTGQFRRDIKMIMRYSRRIEALLGRSSSGEAFVRASQREPLYWPVKAANARVSIYTTRVCG